MLGQWGSLTGFRSAPETEGNVGEQPFWPRNAKEASHCSSDDTSRTRFLLKGPCSRIVTAVIRSPQDKRTQMEA